MWRRSQQRPITTRHTWLNEESVKSDLLRDKWKIWLNDNNKSPPFPPTEGSSLLEVGAFPKKLHLLKFELSWKLLLLRQHPENYDCVQTGALMWKINSTSCCSKIFPQLLPGRLSTVKVSDTTLTADENAPCENGGGWLVARINTHSFNPHTHTHQTKA